MENEINKQDLRKPLPVKKIVYDEWTLENRSASIPVWERILFLDPAPIYARIDLLIDPYKRHAGIQMDQMFPRAEGLCACGCGKIPKSYAEGKYLKWFDGNCSAFASDVLSIINNYFGKPAKYISIYYGGKKCFECEETTDLELDHVVGVKHGGGGSWLSNYRWLCRTHHRVKTNKDFGFKQITKTATTNDSERTIDECLNKLNNPPK